MKQMSRRAWAERQSRLADQALLVERLNGLGLDGVHGVDVHENRAVMVSVTDRGRLRVHRGYAYASDRVLEAIVRFIDPATRRSVRREAERSITEFPVHQFIARSRRLRGHRPAKPSDRRALTTLRRLHRELNECHFEGKLLPVQLRVSSRMETSLGELTVDDAAGALEITISRRHIDTDGWDEVRQTLLHEMIHQWQVEAGLGANHGRSFRQKAKELGISPAAQEMVGDVTHLE
jgi:hypothetical protein